MQPTPTPFIPGQTLYFLGQNNVPVKCEYVQHFRAEVHVVLATEGALGRHWKDTEELFIEKPE